ncbi:hypothetical protein [Agrococcus sp. KRD186]|uniref:hypothetical protein n=1 Tax=Agrococcus sp. KRD186 TaxID=2729730 RepID=UPI001F49A2E2|nr:hypothetical protein [Agrococcus sp. KRD186]
MGLDRRGLTDDLRERLASGHGDRHEHDQQRGGERRHDAEPAPRRRPKAAERECERRQRHQHHHGVHEQRVQGEAGDDEAVVGEQEVHTR